MKNLLFYYPSNKRSNPMETMLLGLREKGYQVKILTICGKGELHAHLEELGFEVYTNNLVKKNTLVYYWKQIRFLRNFCHQHRIDYIHSHLQQANIIALFSQFFSRTKVILFRHHFQYIDSDGNNEMVSKNEIRFDKIINRWARTLVVPSTGVYNSIKQHERVNSKKIHIIPYIYDFDKYEKPDTTKVDQIKKEYPCSLRLIMVSRLVKLKQHHIVIPLVAKLVKKGFDIKLMVLDEGPEKENLEKLIEQEQMQNHIFMLGFRRDFIQYMAAADMLIQPSLSDASNSVAKEMGILSKLIAVTAEVGDYSEYIEHEHNGFLIEKIQMAESLESIITKVHSNRSLYAEMGDRLKKTVISRFDIHSDNNILQKYIQLME